jgi:GNAT superfamily N-acetyltransferase
MSGADALAAASAIAAETLVIVRHADSTTDDPSATLGADADQDSDEVYTAAGIPTEGGFVTYLGPSRQEWEQFSKGAYAQEYGIIQEIRKAGYSIPIALEEQEDDDVVTAEDEERLSKIPKIDKVTDTLPGLEDTEQAENEDRFTKLLIHTNHGSAAEPVAELCFAVGTVFLRCRSIEDRNPLRRIVDTAYRTIELPHARVTIPFSNESLEQEYQLQAVTGGSIEDLVTRLELFHHGKVVSQCVCTYRTSTRRMSGPTIVGMETAKEWRGRGLASALLEATALYYTRLFRSVPVPEKGAPVRIFVDTAANPSAFAWFRQRGFFRGHGDTEGELSVPLGNYKANVTDL